MNTVMKLGWSTTAEIRRSIRGLSHHYVWEESINNPTAAITNRPCVCFCQQWQRLTASFCSKVWQEEREGDCLQLWYGGLPLENAAPILWLQVWTLKNVDKPTWQRVKGWQEGHETTQFQNKPQERPRNQHPIHAPPLRQQLWPNGLKKTIIIHWYVL